MGTHDFAKRYSHISALKKFKTPGIHNTKTMSLSLTRKDSVLSHGVIKELSGRTKKKVSALDKKVTAAEKKLQRLKDKLEAAYDEFGSDSPKVVKLNDLISKTNRQVASLKMKQNKARNE